MGMSGEIIPRYAIYFAPSSESPLAKFGYRWLGREVTTGQECKQLKVSGISDVDLHEVTSFPRKYGFHATLKAPFRLVDGESLETLQSAVAKFVCHRLPFWAPPLKLSRLGHFLALTFGESCPAIDQLAADCVREFDCFRAPLSEMDLERRRRSNLTPSQEEMLVKWGYPYVMSEFRFHMTLTGSLSEPELKTIENGLKPVVEPICQDPLYIDSISIFEQLGEKSSFQKISHFPFSNSEPLLIERDQTKSSSVGKVG